MEQCLNLIKTLWRGLDKMLSSVEVEYLENVLGINYDRFRDVISGIEWFSERDALLLIMHDVQELSPEEIADRLELNCFSVKRFFSMYVKKDGEAVEFAKFLEGMA